MRLSACSRSQILRGFSWPLRIIGVIVIIMVAGIAAYFAGWEEWRWERLRAGMRRMRLFVDEGRSGRADRLILRPGAPGTADGADDLAVLD